MPLELRWRRLAAQNCLKVSSDTSNLALGCIFSKHFTAFFHRHLSQIRRLGFHVSSDLHAIHFVQKDMLPVVIPSHRPWLHSKRVRDLSLNKHTKSHTIPEIFQSNFLAVCDELLDGSKMNNDVAAAAVSRESKAYGFQTKPEFLPLNLLLLISHLI